MSDGRGASAGVIDAARATPAGQAPVLDLDDYAPFLLNAVALAWTRQIAGVFKEDFGLGVVEWRVMAMLSTQPGIPASQICEMLRMDKSAISRSLHLLAERGNLDHEAPTGDLRRREWRLSARGQALFEELLAVALATEAQMLQGVSEDERLAFLGVMRRFLSNLEG